MDKKNVLVLFGGCSPEHEISKASADNVLRHLSEEKYHIIPVYITREGKWLLYDGAIDHVKNVAWEKFGTLAALSPDRVNRGLLRMVGDKFKVIPVDVVFPVLHGENGEDGTIQGLCALAGIPYVGCGVLASAACMDKTFTKMIAKGLGVPQAKYLAFRRDDINAALLRKIARLGFPCFIKPAAGGSSIGITRVTDKEGLKDALAEAGKYSEKIIAEQAVRGREIECGVLGAGASAQASVPGEVLSASVFYDFDAKYNNNESKTLVPAPLPEAAAAEIQETSLRLFKAADCRGLARVDFFWDEETGLTFNEINTVPGFTAISMYAKMWEASGIDFSHLLDVLIDTAMGDYEHSK